MAVVFIIGVMVGLVAMRAGGQAERELALESQRIYQKIRLLSEEAEFTGIEMGFALTTEGYNLFHFSETSLEWVPFTEGDFKPVSLGDHYNLELKLQDEKPDTDFLYKKENREKASDYGEKKHDEPEIIFFSDGQLTPFELILADKNIKQKYYIISGVSPARLSVRAYDR